MSNEPSGSDHIRSHPVSNEENRVLGTSLGRYVADYCLSVQSAEERGYHVPVQFACVIEPS